MDTLGPLSVYSLSVLPTSSKRKKEKTIIFIELFASIFRSRLKHELINFQLLVRANLAFVYSGKIGFCDKFWFKGWI